MKHNFMKLDSKKLITYFIEREQPCFKIEEVRKLFQDSSKGAIRELLRDMTEKGKISRLKEGLYLIIPLGEDESTYLPEWHKLTEYLVENANHYIGYYSALQIHNLITQPSLKQQIVVSKQQKKSKLIIKNVEFQFIYHNKAHFFGSKKKWINNFDRVECSDLEKTIVDCLFKPDYAGGIVEIAKAIFTSKEKINYGTLLNYTILFKSQSVFKRLGYLLETLEIQTDIIEPLLTLRSNSYATLDTELPKEGKRLSRWKILRNLDEETIKSGIYT
jgi:predicted transcriptional regulator of viral defense system